MTNTAVLPLQPAPSAASRGRIFVIPAGLMTTALALLAVWALDRNGHGTNVMGWYANYVFPVGAIVVGVAAGSGYGGASWLSGMRIRWPMLIIILLLQFAAYWIATYLAFATQQLVYRHTGQPMGFIDYYQFTTEGMHWMKTATHDAGQPLGNWGYGLRALEIIGFTAGGIILPLGLSKQPYCERCSVYMSKKQLPTLPASVKTRRVQKSDAAAQAAYSSEQANALKDATEFANDLRIAAENNDVETFQQMTSAAAPSSRQANKLPRRIGTRIDYCKNCSSGFLVADIVSGQGKGIKRQKLVKSSLPVEFVKAVSG